MDVVVNFNPRTREGCDYYTIPKIPESDILIHAPVKGATVFVIGHINRKLYFNPRTREGCDVVVHMKLAKSHILIHAPVKGATAKPHKIDSDFTVLFRKFI